MTKDEMKNRMKHLARKFCRRNNVYIEFDSSVGKLIEKSYLSAYLLCLHESKNKIAELEKENAELKEKLEHRNCVDCSNYGSDVKLMKAKEIMRKLIINAPDTYSGTNIELQQKKMFSFQDAVNKAEELIEVVCQ